MLVTGMVMSAPLRLMIFIDSANIFSAAYDKSGSRIKLESLVLLVSQNQRNVGSYAYVRKTTLVRGSISSWSEGAFT